MRKFFEKSSLRYTNGQFYILRKEDTMIVTIGGIPVYDAVIPDNESGMLKISLVDDPAVMSNFQAFDSHKRRQMYAISDEEKRLVRGVIMRADFPIYRRDDDLGEYYMIFKADTIRQMAEKYLVDGYQNNVNLMHKEDSDVEGVQMVQYFIKGDGVSVEGFDDCSEGSLFGEFHITNDEVWNAIKEGTYKGFSLEGVFDLAPEQDKESVETIVDSLDGKFKRLFKHSNAKNMKKKSKLVRAILSILAEFGNVTTDKGILAWDGDDDLKAGDSVFIEDEEGNRNPAEDGDYKTEDGKTIKVADGKVTEITDPEAEVGDTFGRKTTDKGELLWDGEEDLKEGDAVYVENADGERVPAEDGDYKTEDGKVIKVVDGKVDSITDDSAEVAPEAELKAKRHTRFAKIREAFEDSYEEKERKIVEAVAAILAEGEYAYLVEAGDNYAIFNIFTDDNYEGKYIKYEVSFAEDGSVTLGASEEVKNAFVPVNDPNPADPQNAPTEEEMSVLKAENEALKAENEKLKKTPAAKPAHEEVETAFQAEKTGDKRLDRLAALAAARRK